MPSKLKKSEKSDKYFFLSSEPETRPSFSKKNINV